MYKIIFWMSASWLWAQDSLLQEKWRKVQGLSKSPEMDKITDPSATSIGALVGQMVLGLVIVLLLIGVTLFLLKKLQMGTLKTTNSPFGLKLLDQMSLGQGQRICIVEASGKTMVLGVTSENIQILRELQENEIPTDLKTSQQEFSETINSVLSRFKRGGSK